MKRTEEEKQNMQNFIKQQFGENVTDEEIENGLESLYREAHNYSDWGL